MKITQAAKQNNLNNYRLKELLPLSSVPGDLQDEIRSLLSSKGDRAHQSAGILAWAIFSHQSPVFIMSLDDMNQLIQKGSSELPEGAFDVSSKRASKNKQDHSKTIYSQFTGFVLNNAMVKLLQESKGNKPAVVEVVDMDLLERLKMNADEVRNVVLASVNKDTRTQGNKNTILQDNNITSIQGNKITRQSETQSATQDETHNETQSETQDINKISKIAELQFKLSMIDSPQEIQEVINEFSLIGKESINCILESLNLGTVSRIGWSRLKYNP